MRTLIFFAILVAGCGGDDAPTDMGCIAYDLGSHCGQPCDPGNSLGVGKFCTQLSDCKGNKEAVLCSSIGTADNYFCTMICPGPDAGESFCGENAHCQCGSGSAESGCGCYPNYCPP
jgi:hypothetical protein